MPLILNPYAFAPLSLAFQTSANSSAQTITCPTVAQYDVGVLFDSATNTAATPPTAVIPSGFTQLQTSSLTFYRTTISYKVFTGSEGGASLTGLNGDFSNAKLLLVFRPNFSIGSVGVSTFLQETANTDPASQLIAASGQAAPLLRLAICVDGTDAAAPSFTSGTFDATATKTGSGNGIRVGYAILNSSPTDNTVDTGDNGNGNCLMSGWMNFT